MYGDTSIVLEHSTCIVAISNKVYENPFEKNGFKDQLHFRANADCVMSGDAAITSSYFLECDC